MTDTGNGSLNAHTVANMLRSLAMQMENAAAEMDELAETEDCLLAKHSIELRGAAEICRDWADNVSSLAVHYKLPADFFCRCRDKACPQRESCLRWLARNQGAGNSGFVSESTLRTGRSGMDEPCKYYVDPLEV